MSISGSVPAYALFGVPVSGVVPAGQVFGSRAAPPSGPYLGRGNKCSAKDDTCEGNKVKDEDFCAGHLRSVKKLEATDGV